jgi:hypothetical protein
VSEPLVYHSMLTSMRNCIVAEYFSPLEGRPTGKTPLGKKVKSLRVPGRKHTPVVGYRILRLSFILSLLTTE